MPDQVKATIRPGRIWHANVPITGQVVGPVEAWPAQMQDAIYEAMEKVIKENGLKELTLIKALAIFDGQSWYAHIAVMEKLGPEDVIVSTIQ